jgi:hypothetical protein
MAQGGGKSPPQLVLSMTSRTSRRFPEQRLTREEVLVMLSELIPRPPACGEHLSVLVRQVVRCATDVTHDPVKDGDEKERKSVRESPSRMIYRATPLVSQSAWESPGVASIYWPGP